MRKAHRPHRMETEGLPHNSLDVREVLAVCDCRQSARPHDAVNLLSGLRLDFRMDGHHEEEGVQRADGLIPMLAIPRWSGPALVPFLLRWIDCIPYRHRPYKARRRSTSSSLPRPRQDFRRLPRSPWPRKMAHAASRPSGCGRVAWAFRPAPRWWISTAWPFSGTMPLAPSPGCGVLFPLGQTRPS